MKKKEEGEKGSREEVFAFLRIQPAADESPAALLWE